MAKLGKILAKVIALLVLLGAMVLALVVLLVDPNDFKGEITAAVERATGHPLVITGPIRLSLLPWLGIELSDLTLGNPPGFGESPLARVRRAQLRAELWPLLQRRLVVEQVRAEGLRLSLQRDGTGRGNWEALGGRRAAGAPAETPPPPSVPPVVATALGGLTIARVELRDAELVWLDAQGTERLALRALTFDSGAFEPGLPLDVRLGFDLEDPRAALRGPVALTATLRPTASWQQLRVEPLTLEASLRGPRLPKGPLEVEASGALALDRVAQTLTADPVHLTSGSLALSGSVQGQGLGSASPTFGGTCALAELNPRDWLAGVGWTLPEITDPTALRRLAASTDWRLSEDTLALSGLGVRLDETSLRGEATLGPLPAPAFRFQFSIDRLDLDRYRPLRAPPTGKGATGGAAPPAPPAPRGDSPFLALGLIRDLDLEGRLSIGALTLAKLRLGDAEIRIRSQKRQVQLEDQVGQFYQGRLQGRLGLDGRGQTPRLSLEQQGTGIQVGPLLQDLTGEARLTGRGQLRAHLITEGDSELAARRNLSGEVGLTLREGSVSGVDLGQTIREAKARLRGEPPPKPAGPLRTEISELDFRGQVQGGVLHDDLSAKSPELRVTGSGTLDLVSETLDYRLKPVLLSTPKGAGIKELEELKGVPIPVSVTGPLAEPQWRVDLAALATELGKARLHEELDQKENRALERLDKKLEGKTGIKGLGQGLRDLLGR